MNEKLPPGSGTVAAKRTPRVRRLAVFRYGAALLLAGAGAGFSYLLWQGSQDAALGPPADDSVRLAQRRAAPSFDLSEAIIPLGEIRRGGPPKDGIPALSDPAVLRAEDAGYLRDADRVAGVSIDRESRAYPLRILNYHEIVNDTLGDVPIAVTYCPLCDSVAVFDRRGGDGVREFGVSGLLYNSNVLMYDRGGRPESLWSQAAARGVSGPGAGEALEALPVELTTWEDWKSRHPKTTVLSTETGHARNYNTNPYRGYFRSRGLMFPVRPLDKRLPAKTPVLGVWSNGKARAYPPAAFNSQNTSTEQQLDGKPFELVYDPQHESLRVAEAGDGLQWMYAYWFAWAAFRPQTEVYNVRP